MNNVKTDFYRKMLLAWIVTSVTFMELLDTSILHTALPVIAQSLHTSIFELKTAITAYMAALAIFIPISGWIADVLGTKITIISAIFLFTGSSLACGFAQSVPQLVIFRIFQGIGGAMMTPVARLIMIRLFKGEELAKAAGLVAIPILFGPITGPVLGGYITTNYHWSWIFFINVPIGLAAIALIWKYLDGEKAEKYPPFDLQGFLMAGLGLSLLSFALENLENPMFPKWFCALLIITGIILAIRLVYHCRGREHAVFDLSLFSLHTFKDGIWLTVIGFVATSGLNLLLPVMFQTAFGLTPFQSGLLVFTVSIGSMLAKPLIVPISARFGYRKVLISFPLAIAAAVFSFCLITPSLSKWITALLLFIYGLSFSFLGNLQNIVPYIEVPREKTSIAISLQATLFRFSIGLGVSLSSLMLGGFLHLYGANLHEPSSRAGAISSFHWCFVVIGLLCVMLSLNDMRFKDSEFASLTKKS